MTFYTLTDYHNWKMKNTKKCSIKYYKGLGTSTSKEAKEYFTNLIMYDRQKFSERNNSCTQYIASK